MKIVRRRQYPNVVSALYLYQRLLNQEYILLIIYVVLMVNINYIFWLYTWNLAKCNV